MASRRGGGRAKLTAAAASRAASGKRVAAVGTLGAISAAWAASAVALNGRQLRIGDAARGGGDGGWDACGVGDNGRTPSSTFQV